MVTMSRKSSVLQPAKTVSKALTPDKTHDLNFKETFVFTQAWTGDYRLRVSLLSIPIGEAHLTVRKRPR
jgi:hypothetical protein